MKKCETCRYLLVRDRCPICGGRQIPGVERVQQTIERQSSPNNIAETLKLYWSPQT